MNESNEEQNVALLDLFSKFESMRIYFSAKKHLTKGKKKFFLRKRPFIMRIVRDECEKEKRRRKEKALFIRII